MSTLCRSNSSTTHFKPYVLKRQSAEVEDVDNDEPPYPSGVPLKKSHLLKAADGSDDSDEEDDDDPPPGLMEVDPNDDEDDDIEIVEEVEESDEEELCKLTTYLAIE